MYLFCIFLIGTLVFSLIYYFGFYQRFCVASTEFYEKWRAPFGVYTIAKGFLLFAVISGLSLFISCTWLLTVCAIQNPAISVKNDEQTRIVSSLEEYADYVADGNALSFLEEKNFKDLLFEAKKLNKEIEKSLEYKNNKFINWYHIDYSSVSLIDVNGYYSLVLT